MALILKNGHYLKLNIDGSYVIYKNKTARNRDKKSTTSEEILNKYFEILAEFRTKEYQRYHENDGEAAAWRKEFTDYTFCLQGYITGHKFPLMEKYYPDVNKTIPEILSSGNIHLTRPTLEELYQLVKKLEIFGTVEEIKDI